MTQPVVPELVVFPERRPRFDLLFTRFLIVVVCALLALSGGVTIETWFIPPAVGYVGLVLIGLAMVRGIALAVRRGPSISATEHGLTVRGALWLTLGPIPWHEVRLVREITMEDSEDRRLSIILKDAAATCQRLRQNWYGLLRWLTALGDPLRLDEDELDRPVGELVEQLEALRKSAVH